MKTQTIQYKINIIKESPKFLLLLSFIEMWERFSYYGMRALLVIFMTSVFGFSDPKAYAIYSVYAALSYAGPVLGGILADRLMGFQKMIVLGALVNSFGHLAMVFSGISQTMFYIGLGFVAFGSGMFKGNISNLLGSCYNDNDPKRDSGFTVFYVAVNLGGFLASVLCGYVAYAYGWHYGFGLAGIGMLLGVITLIRFRAILNGKGMPPKPDALKRSLSIKTTASSIKILNPFLRKLSNESLVWIGSGITSLICALILYYSENMMLFFTIIGIATMAYVSYEFTKQSSKDKRNMFILGLLTIFFVCFFALEMQIGSLIALFTERNVETAVFGITIPSTVSQSMNPLSIILFGSLANRLWLKIGYKHNLTRFGGGLAMMVISFLALYIGCLTANSGGLVNYSYLIISAFAMGIGELCIAPLMLSLCSLLAPQRLKGFFMGVLMLSMAFANMAGMLIGKFMSVPQLSPGLINPLVSLNIYQEGFFKIMVFNIALCIVFIGIIPLINKITNAINYKYQ